jgi:hypothetical protein
MLFIYKWEAGENKGDNFFIQFLGSVQILQANILRQRLSVCSHIIDIGTYTLLYFTYT